jgi:hypothetical protein
VILGGVVLVGGMRTLPVLPCGAFLGVLFVLALPSARGADGNFRDPPRPDQFAALWFRALARGSATTFFYLLGMALVANHLVAPGIPFLSAAAATGIWSVAMTRSERSRYDAAREHDDLDREQ